MNQSQNQFNELTDILQRATDLADTAAIEFPDIQKLMEDYEKFPPDFPEHFQKGYKIYVHSDTGCREDQIQAALAFYLSSEDPPENVRYAIIRLLREVGAYEEAILYGASFLRNQPLKKLLVAGFPLIDEKKNLHVAYLMMPGMDCETVLACLLFHLLGKKEGLSKLHGVVSAIVESHPPLHILKAVCLFLLVVNRQVFSDSESIRWLLKLAELSGEHIWLQIADELLSLDSHPAPSQPYLVSAPEVDLSPWHTREEAFEQLYANRDRHGWIVLGTDPHHGYIWCPGSMTLHPLSGTEYDIVALELSDAAQAHKFPPVCFQRDESNHLTSLIIQRFPTNTNILIWCNILKRLARFYLGGKVEKLEGLVRQRLKTSAYPFPSVSLEHFHDYIGDVRYNQSTAKKMIVTLEHGIHEGNIPDEDAVLEAILKYYLKIRDYDAINAMLEEYSSQKFHEFYKHASILLFNYLRLGTALQSPLNDSDEEWEPEALHGLDIFHPISFWKGADDRTSSFEVDDESDDAHLAEQAEELERQADEDLRNNHKAACEKADCYSRAARLYWKLGSDEGYQERAEKCMICSLFWMARAKETELIDSSKDDYLFLLYWKSSLRPHSIELLNNSAIIEESERRYFNPVPSYYDGTLCETIKTAASTKTWKQIAIDLLSLMLCDPNILRENSRFYEVFSNSEIQNKLQNLHPALRIWHPKGSDSLSTKASSSKSFLTSLRTWRDNMAIQFNQYSQKLCSPVLCESDSLGGLEKTIQKTCENYQALMSSNLWSFLCMRSKTDEKYLLGFQELLNETVRTQDGRGHFLTEKLYNRCVDFRMQLEDAPSLYAVVLVSMPLRLLLRYFEEYLLSLRASLRPSIKAKVLFAETASPDSDGNPQFCVYFRLVCGNANPAKHIRVHIWPDGKSEDVCEYMGKGVNGHGSLKVPASFAKAGKLDFEVEFSYQAAETGENLTTQEHFSLSLPTPVPAVYQPVYNSTRVLSGKDPKDNYLFLGRKNVIRKICNEFRAFPNVIYLLYGQKRVGKSSLAHYVINELRKDRKERSLLVASLWTTSSEVDTRRIAQAGFDQTESAVLNFLSHSLNGIKNAFTNKPYQDRADCLKAEREAIARAENDMKKARCLNEGQHIFNDALHILFSGFQRESQWRGTRILLCCDEFQNYYSKILRGTLHSSFIDYLKGFKESEFPISLLLVGMELMEPFIQEYWPGNVRSVIREVKLDYLEEADAKDLISKPVREWNQLMGNEVPNPFQYVEEELFHLTAGSPVYIHLICENLLDMLTREKKTFASMDMIARLLKGSAIKSADFDTLYNPENLKSSEQALKFASPSDSKAVFRQIALIRGRQQLGKSCECNLQNLCEGLAGKTDKSVEAIVQELFNRGVLSCNEGEYRITVPLYERWLWEHEISDNFESALGSPD